MKTKIKRRIPVKIELVVRRACHICDLVQKEIESITKVQSNIDLLIINADSARTFPGNSQPYVTPAVWVNDKLWYLGGFDSSTFVKKLEHITN